MNAIARHKLARPIILSIVFWLMAVLTGCSGSGGTASLDTGSPPPPPPPPPAASGPFSGDANATLGSVIGDFYVVDPVTDAEYSVDATGYRVQRTAIKIVFDVTATVGDANELLTDLQAELIATLEGYPAAVVRIPDPGSLEELRTLISSIEATGVVHSVLESEYVITNSLPDNLNKIIFDQGDPSSATQWALIDHHLAIRGGAAWSLQALTKSKPKVVIMDYFGSGDPITDFVDYEPLPNAADLGFFESPLATDDHGYEVLSIIAARHSDSGRSAPADLATGMNPFGIQVGVSDMTGVNAKAAEVLMMRMIRDAADATPGPVIANMSIGRDCKPNVNGTPCNSGQQFEKQIIDFIRSVRHIGEERVLFVVSAGNIKDNGSRDAVTESEWAAAGLGGGWTDPRTQELISPLENVLVVENAEQNSATSPPFGAGCVHASSFVGGELAGIGENIYALLAPNGDPAVNDGKQGGTSHATAQVSGVAAYVSSLRPELNALQLKALLLETARPLSGQGKNCSGDGSFAEIVDAYAASLTVDPAGAISPNVAKARIELLDITAADMGDTPDGVFDIYDLRQWILKLDDPAVPNGQVDYSRFDLNGDGVTGGKGAEKFDLDLSYDVNNPGSMLYSNVNTDFLGKSVSYDENALTDMELVCYYANSDLYELGQADPFTAEVRDAELEKVRTSCDPCLAALEAAQKLGGFTAKLGAPDPVCELPELLIAATRVYEFQGETVTNLEIFKVSGDGQTFVQLTQTPDPLGYTYVHHPAWSPNRDKIAFTWFLDIGEHVFVMDADGENKVALTDSDPEPARHFHPAWSPDGRKIAYVRSSQSGVFEIYVMNADGTDQQKMVTRNGLISEIGWSPDGTKMAFAQWSPDETSDIVVANVVVDVVNDLETWTLENPVTVVSGDINLSPEWSPDGQKILYVHAADLISDRNLFVVETSTLEIQQLTGLNDPNNPGGGQEFVREYDADWSPDGTQIAMMRSGEVWVINADGSDLVQLTPTNANLIVEEVDW